MLPVATAIPEGGGDVPQGTAVREQPKPPSFPRNRRFWCCLMWFNKRKKNQTKKKAAGQEADREPRPAPGAPRSAAGRQHGPPGTRPPARRSQVPAELRGPGAAGPAEDPGPTPGTRRRQDRGLRPGTELARGSSPAGDSRCREETAAGPAAANPQPQRAGRPGGSGGGRRPRAPRPYESEGSAAPLRAVGRAVRAGPGAARGLRGRRCRRRLALPLLLRLHLPLEELQEAAVVGEDVHAAAGPGRRRRGLPFLAVRLHLVRRERRAAGDAGKRAAPGDDVSATAVGAALPGNARGARRAVPPPCGSPGTTANR